MDKRWCIWISATKNGKNERKGETKKKKIKKNIIHRPFWYSRHFYVTIFVKTLFIFDHCNIFDEPNRRQRSALVVQCCVSTEILMTQNEHETKWRIEGPKHGCPAQTAQMKHFYGSAININVLCFVSISGSRLKTQMKMKMTKKKQRHSGRMETQQNNNNNKNRNINKKNCICAFWWQEVVENGQMRQKSHRQAQTQRRREGERVDGLDARL